MLHKFHFLRLEISPNDFSAITNLSVGNPTMTNLQVVSFAFFLINHFYCYSITVILVVLLYKTTVFHGCVKIQSNVLKLRVTE